MNARDLQRAFKSCPWSNTSEIDAFVQQYAPDIAPADLAKVLDILNDKKLARDAQQHRVRCAAFAKLGEAVADRVLFIPYVRALKVADPHLRKVLANMIPRVNNMSAHNELCALLRSDDVQIRKTAAELLGQVGGKTTAQLLGRMLVERKIAGRKEAMDALVQTAGHFAVVPLEAVAVGRYPAEDRVHALKYLGDPQFMARATSKALTAIRRVLLDGNEVVKIAAIEAFSGMCAEDDFFEEISPYLYSSNLRYVRVAVNGLSRFHSRRAIIALERKLRAGPNSIRMSVLTTLENIGRNEVIPPLVEALTFKQINVKTRASEVLRSLAASGKVDLARTIVWLLRSKDVDVRRMAVEIAGSIKDDRDELWPKLLKCLRDEDWWVRERVIDALIQMAGPKLTRHIVGYVKEESDIMRRFAVGVLGKLKDPQALGTLVRVAQKDEDWWVREKSIEAIAAIGDARAIPYVVQLMEERKDLTLVCLHALRELGPGSVIDRITNVMSTTDDDDVRFAALQCLQGLEDASLAKQVEPLQNHNRSQIRLLSRELLRKWQVQVDNKSALKDESVSLLDRYLIHMQEQGGEDLIIAAGQRPVMKRLGQVQQLTDRPLGAKLVKALLVPLLNGKQLADLDQLRDVDFSYEVESQGLRFRVNLFHSLNGMAAVFREVKEEIPNLATLGLPPIVQTLGDLKNGLVLMGGPTGSGKSTTLAALINYINTTYDRHIISIEDPIEVVHRSRRGLVNQRELGTHTGLHQDALRATLRQDPDVILVGELRDYPTISFAVSAAETGHLVFGTVHTVSAAHTVDRLINAFPGSQGEQVRAMLADSLRAVVCQHLLRKVDGKGRVVAVEIMVCTEAISSLIRKGKAFQIPGVISTNANRGMRLMDQSLMELFQQGNVHAEEVYMKAINKKEFESIFDPTRLGAKRVKKVSEPAPWDQRQNPPLTEEQEELILSEEEPQGLTLEGSTEDVPLQNEEPAELILSEVVENESSGGSPDTAPRRAAGDDS